MSGFIASPPEPASAPGSKVTGGAFWPDIDLNNFRDTMRIGGSTIPDPRLIKAIEAAIITVTADLREWRLDKLSEGHPSLAAVSDEEINGEKALVVIWKRAVMSFATADLMETHRDVSATNEGAKRAEEQLPTAADHRRNGVHAIRDILGVSRTTVELI
ncbi:head completion/stabilization protein [Asticcacaulis machinosus]|uniref:Head completion/stabilization protein n=1 Tax=Asticcacaulis machinosus TaxID=2984211 RepID=A0ABT5HGW6_9CAUL|nr:head completion/stabilization protein [Asticcacaulis machinosus]MDC7675370.1 head completion/stabilization protein [Asticcacaulis machinosus]